LRLFNASGSDAMVETYIMTRFKGDFPSLGGSLRSHHLGFKATNNKQLLFA